MADKNAKINDMSFETAMTRLEQIVRELEDGKVSLDDSLKLYEEGIALVRLCSGRLDEAEQKIKIIRTSSDGTKAEEDFTE
jgi:exodeoxyribonuclease VII small subunit